MMKSTIAMLALVGCLGATEACTPARTSTSFSNSEAMRAQPVAFGEVVSVRNVDIRPGQTRLGAITGAALGAVGGSQIGGDTASNIAGGVAGAVAGGAIGSAIQGSQRTAGLEITVRLDSGETVAIVQPGDPRDFRMGDRVRVIGNADNARVAR